MKKLTWLGVGVFGAVLGLSGCNGVGASPQWNQDLKDVMRERTTLSQWSGSKPWLSVSNYLEFWPAHAAETGAWLQTIRASGAEVFCQQLFLSRLDWVRIRERCTHGDFFLCHPDAEAEGVVLKKWLGQQTTEFRQEWSRAEQCRQLAAEWGD